MKNPTMYVFVNKACKMSPGKMAAQVAHAQEELFFEIFKYGDEEKKKEYLEILNQNPRTVIVLEAENEETLYNINAYLESCKLTSGIYVDEKGDNYLLKPTAMAVEYVDKTDPRIEIIFQNFPLYEYVDEIYGDLYQLYMEESDVAFGRKSRRILREIKRLCLKKGARYPWSN